MHCLLIGIMLENSPTSGVIVSAQVRHERRSALRLCNPGANCLFNIDHAHALLISGVIHLSFLDQLRLALHRINGLVFA